MALDAIEVLTSDHRDVESLFQQVEGGSYGRDDVVAQIVRELSIHDGLERELLYPFVRKTLAAEGEDLAAHLLDEHDGVAGLLADLEAAHGNATERDEILARLMPSVKTHVEEEEQVVFPRLRRAGAADLIELGAKIQEARKRAPTHPHPRAPRSTAGAKVGGKVAGMMDKVKDKVQDAAKE